MMSLALELLPGAVPEGWRYVKIEATVHGGKVVQVFVRHPDTGELRSVAREHFRAAVDDPRTG